MKLKNLFFDCFLILLVSFPFEKSSGLFAQTWTGTISTDWNNPCNWNNSSVPACTDNVIIPGGTPFQPTIGVGQKGYCLTIDINSSAGANLTINSSSSGELLVGCVTAPPSCPSPCTVTIYPVADTRIRYASYCCGYEGTNYGSDGIMVTETNYGYLNWQEYTFIRFPLSAIPAGATITSASLNVYLWAQGCGPAVTSTVNAYYLNNTTWVENTITWNNYPAQIPGGIPGIWQSSLSIDNSTQGWKSFGVANVNVQNNLAGGLISYTLFNTDYAGPSGKCWITKENCNLTEYLSVTYTY